MPDQEPNSHLKPAASEAFTDSCTMCGSEKLCGAGEKDGYTFYECGNCNFIFCGNVEQAQMEEQYANGYNALTEEVPEDGWAYSLEFLQPALQLFPQGKRLQVLDFGCGQSHIPQRLAEKYGHQVTAVDVVPPQRPYRGRLTGNILELDLPQNHFDLIYSFQVFEHIREPLPVLDRLLELVRPGGYLLIHTDMETPERFEGHFTDWWYVIPPDHCAFYRHKTFEHFVGVTPHRLALKEPKMITLQKGEAVTSDAVKQ